MSSNMNFCQEVKQRIAVAKEVFNRKRSIFCGPLEKELSKRLVKYFVWSVALYGAETWTLRRNEQKRPWSISDVDMEKDGACKMDRQNKKCSCARKSAGIVMLHDNARPHKAWRSTHLLQEFSLEVFTPYDPDLTLCDFLLFLHLKKILSGQRQHIQNDRGMEMNVTMVPFPGGRLLQYRIQKLIPQYDKCFSSRGEYVEKFLNACSICSNKSLITLGFVFVNSLRETYFMNALHTCDSIYLKLERQCFLATY